MTSILESPRSMSLESSGITSQVSPVFTQTDAAPPATKRLACHICQRTFGRPEHLKRHEYSHIEQRPFVCSTCGKRYSRDDSLRRHEFSHKNDNSAELSMYSSRAANACMNCAAARVRCVGKSPCERCSKRSVDCQRPRKRVKTDATSTPDEHRLSEDQSDPSTCDSGGIVFSPAQETQYSAPIQEAADNHRIKSQVGNPNTGSSIPNAFAVPQWGVPAPLGSFVNVGSMNSNLVTDDSAVTQVISQIGLEPEYIDSGIMSNLNWLPFDFDPNFYDTAAVDSVALSSRRPDAMGLPGTTGVANTSFQDRFAQGFPLNFNYSSRSQEILSPISGNPSTHSDTDSANHQAGSYYVDGGGARLSKGRGDRRSAPRWPRDKARFMSQDNSPCQFPLMAMFPDFENRLDEILMGTTHLRWISTAVYQEMTACFEQLCARDDNLSAVADCMPSMKLLNHFIQLAVDNFLTVVPIIHVSSIGKDGPEWLLYLALAAIGSHYIDVEDAERCAASMHDLLSQAIVLVTKVARHKERGHIRIAQVKILSLIGSLYGGDEILADRARIFYNDLIEFFIIHASASGSSLDQNSQTININWTVWLKEETLYRVLYYIWLLDCMLAYHSSTRPRFTLEDTCIPLPCLEVLWDCNSEAAWRALNQCLFPNPSLHSATQLLYMEKRVRASIGEFGRILLIHALFQRTWDVENFHRKPLSSWTPTAQTQSNVSSIPADSVWLPGNAAYSRWRNSACDCLDVLHWAANGVIGAAAGLEHPTVLHLHLARVVLLAPYQNIRQLAFMKANLGMTLSFGEIRTAEIEVQRWLKDDQFKARLAMIHAGVLLWHIRRHSANGFYEPDAVLLAILALWAYASDNRTASQHVDNDSHRPASPEPASPDFIHLDRPCDDELVQLFIKNGDTMTANITGVGNIRSPGGSVRILREGCKLLSMLTNWGTSAKYIEVLTKLANVIDEGETMGGGAALSRALA